MATAIAWIYWPTLYGDWLWDDDLYITDNALLRNLSGLWQIWFHPGASLEYYPLFTTVEWMQWHLWGLDRLGYHLTNIALHLTSSLLIWRLFAKLGLRLAWLGGLLFAIHPVQVESVAWITELKNTLSLPPFLVAMGAWIDFDAEGSRRDYYRALGFFLIAMLCKTTMALYPAIILLYAWWKRGRIGSRDLRNIAPFLAVSLALGLTSIASQDHQSHPNLSSSEIFSSASVACESIPFYLSKFFLPVGLVPFYPPINPYSPMLLLGFLVLIGMMGWFWMKRADWGRHALLGLGFFLVNLVPVFVIIVMKYNLMIWSLDHMVYLPIIGLIGLLVAGLNGVDRQLPRLVRPFAIALATMVLVLLTWESRGYASLFVNQETLLTYTLRYNPQDWIVHNNFGYSLLESGQTSRSMEQFNEALLIKPEYAEAHNNLGKAFFQMGRIPEATEQFEQAVRIKPEYAQAHSNLGSVLIQANKISEAIDQFREAVRIKPDFPEGHSNLGNALSLANRLPEALEQYKLAFQIKPDFVEAHTNMGIALLQVGRTSEAIDQFEEALQIKPDDATAHDNLAKAQALLISMPAKN